MIPASLLSIDLAANAADPNTEPSLTPVAGDNGDSFTDFISQALNAPSPDNGFPDAQAMSAQMPPTDTGFQPAPAISSNESDSTDESTSDGGASQSDSDKNRISKASKPETDNQGLDALTANYLAGMLAQPIAVATNDNLKAPVSAGQGRSPEKHESVAMLTISDTRNSSLPSALEVNDAGQQSSSSNRIPSSSNRKIGDASKLAATVTTTAKAAESAISSANDSSDTPTKDLAANTQMAGRQLDAGLVNNPAATAAIDGTTAAFEAQRMKFTAQKDESAGSTGSAVQKLPRATAIGPDSGRPKAPTASVLATGSSGRRSDFASLPTTLDLVSSVDSGSLRDATVQDASHSLDGSTSQVERVARMVMQEAMTIRQSGATSLAVSLKVDAHTELFVQLTNHDGLIQASLRCDQGNIAGLAGHWGQLQESLARHNVQLLPPDNGTFSKNQSDYSSNPGNSRQNEQPSQNQQQNSNSLKTASTQSSIPAKARASKTRTSDGSNWEYWA
jgi:hypothetical protein